MKEKLLKKRNEKGFTLMEMLIVVAIIAILVAIAIPVFNTQLEKAREATDTANKRAAKTVAVANYLTEGNEGVGTFFFDAAAGTLETDKTGIDGYGQGGTGGEVNEDAAEKVIQVDVGADGSVDSTWVEAG